VKKLKVGIIGLGKNGKGRHFDSLSKLDFVEIKACSDISGKARKSIRETFSGKLYDDYEKLLDEDDIQLVVVATQSSIHAEIAIKAMTKGKHVLVEKPMATSGIEALEMLNVSKKTGRILTVFQNRRLDPDFLAVQEVITSGKLGDIFEISGGMYEWKHRSDWQTQKEYGGGLLNNFGSHLLDQWFILMEGAPRSVFVRLRQYASSGDAEDYVRIDMISKRDIFCSLTMTYCSAFALPRFYICGTKGTLIVSAEGMAQLKYEIKKDKFIKKIFDTKKYRKCSATTTIYKNIYNVLRNSEKLIVSAESVCKVIKFIDICRESSEKEKMIEIKNN